jgi:hypothetical protein
MYVEKRVIIATGTVLVSGKVFGHHADLGDVTFFYPLYFYSL